MWFLIKKGDGSDEAAARLLIHTQAAMRAWVWGCSDSLLGKHGCEFVRRFSETYRVGVGPGYIKGLGSCVLAVSVGQRANSATNHGRAPNSTFSGQT